MSTTAPPASGPRPAPNHPSATTSAPAPCAPALLPAAGIALGEELGGDALDAGAAHRPEVDVETMRSIHAQVRDLVRRESSVGAPGFRLVCVLEGDISWRDIRIDGPGYAVLGSHRGCDVVLARDRGIWRRHLAAICVPVEDGRVGLRLVGLATDQPFFLDDDTPRQAVLVRGSFAMRVGRHVICGFPIGERADIGSPSEFTLCPPVSQLGAVSSVGDVRVILVRGHVGAVVDLPAAAFDGGVLIGRALRCCDEGLRRVCGDANLARSRAHRARRRRHARLRSLLQQRHPGGRGPRAAGPAARRRTKTSARQGRDPDDRAPRALGRRGSACRHPRSGTRSPNVWRLLRARVHGLRRTRLPSRGPSSLPTGWLPSLRG